MADYYEITLALSGVCQATKLVQQFAHNGDADPHAFKHSLQTLLQTAPENVLAVYGGEAKHLKLGLETLMEQLNGRDVELTRYWVSLLALEGKLNKLPDVKSQLAQRIAYLPSQLSYYDLLDEQMITNLASIYVDIISPLGNRIQVLGSSNHLQRESIQHRIRACLLAGIRSAVLWRQVGGKKYQFLFSRSKIATTAQQIYSTL